MKLLNLPNYEVKTKKSDDKLFIFDCIRNKYVALTPEEWVRQHFVNFLIEYKNFPKNLIANEVGIKLNGTIKRCDTVLYNKFLQPYIIVEYKAPDISITNKVFDQIARYNMELKAKILIVSNGINHYCCLLDYSNNSYHFLKDIPNYNDIKEDVENYTQ